MRSDIKTTTRKILMVVAAAMSIVVVISLASAQGGKKTGNAGNTPFTGVWETVAGSATKYTVRLTQTGNKVTGTYSPRNGKIFGGVVTGSKLTFNWTQDGGYEGTGEFTLNDDGKGFAGSGTAIKPVSMTNSWKTYVPGPPRSFAGVWDAKFGVRKTTLSISQEGNKVTGVYPEQCGSIEGTVLEQVLRFTWESEAGRGSGMVWISTSGESFGGWFNNGNDPDVKGERSEGTRRPDDGEIVGACGRKKMGSYAGTWVVTEAGAKGAMEFKQSDAVVTGVYRTAKGSFDVQEASVNGTILRFVLIPRNASNSVKAGEIILDDPKGKSFKGTIDGIPVTGALINR